MSEKDNQLATPKFPDVQFIDSDADKALYQKLGEPVYRVGDTGISSKNLLHWKTSDILLQERSDESGWTRFSFVQYIWLQIVVELRDFGFSLEKIQSIKEQLTFPEDLQQIAKEYYNVEAFQKEPGFENSPRKLLKAMAEDYSFNYTIQTFHRILFECIRKRINYQIVVFKNGDSYFHEDGKQKLFKRFFEDGNEIWSLTKVPSPRKKLPLVHDEYLPAGTLDKEETRFKSSITISITQLIQDYLLYSSHSLKVDALPILSDNEKELLYHINRKDVKKITLRYKNHKPEILEVEEDKTPVDLASRYSDHILKHGYQTINYTMENGSMVSFTRSTKIKLK